MVPLHRIIWSRVICQCLILQVMDHLHEDLSSLLCWKVSLSMVEVWNEMALRVPSNPNRSGVLWSL